MMKWFVYGVALLPVLILEVYVLNRFPLFGIRPMLLPLAAVTVAVLEGGVAGGSYGLFVGVLCDALYHGQSGGWTLGIALLGIAAGVTAQYRVRQNLVGCLICSVGALLALDTVRVVWRLFLGVAPLGALLRVALPEIAWSLAFVFPLYALFHWVYSRTQFATLF